MKQALQSGFVSEHTLEIEKLEGLYTLCGEIACRGDIVITVKKEIEILVDGGGDEDLVQTREYSYNASVRGAKTFLRHDNAHIHPGHSDEHHRHELDWRTEKNLPGSPFWVGEQGWPTLGEFIDAVEKWYWGHKSELPTPEGFPRLGLRD